jgi:predicted glutamine amidotransferase
MCLIFTNKEKQLVNLKAMQNAYRSNPDGLGILLWDNSQWIAERHIDTPLEPIVDKLNSYDKFAIHFRYATHGRVSISNCHPFSLGNGWYIMHNGILPYTPTKSNRSDTWQLSQYLKAMGVTTFTPRQWKAFLPILRESIGSDRILIANPNGKILRLGQWTQRSEGYYSNGGCLWSKSNTTHVPKFPSYTPNTDSWDSWNDDSYVIGGYAWDNRYREGK